MVTVWEIDERKDGQECGVAGPFRSLKAAREALPVVAAGDYPHMRAVAHGKECIFLSDGQRVNAVVLVIQKCEFAE